jgi:hypothetical protein
MRFGAPLQSNLAQKQKYKARGSCFSAPSALPSSAGHPDFYYIGKI